MAGLLFGFVMWTITAWSGAPTPQSEQHPGSSPARVDLEIAAPTDLDSALTELGRQFEAKTGNRIHFSFFGPPSVLKQVQSGSAFDVVFLPNMEEVRQLAASGTVTSTSVMEYAREQMVLCIAPGVRIEPRPGNPLFLLTDKGIPRIAIASPQTSVFGKATVQALTAVHIYDFELRRKLVVGSDVAEVAQLIAQGRADVALLPASAIRTYQLGSTRVITLPSKGYSPIGKGAAVLRKSKHPRQALEFLQFAASAEGKAAFGQAGFDEPQPSIAKKH